MTSFALTLVLLSAVAHATWNFLLKQHAINPEVFIWGLMLVVTFLLLPVGVALAIWDPIVGPGWWYVLGTILLHIIYFVFLGRGYAHGDLSLVYPIARGVGPAFAPILGVLVLNETVAGLAIAGIGSVVVGIFTIYWWGNFTGVLRDPLRLLREPGVCYALLTGLVITSYSVWDKVGVRYVNSFLYMYLMSVGIAIGLAPYVLRTYGTRLIRQEWRANSGTIVLAGLLTFIGYGLVLTALQSSRVSYVWPSREVGIVIGVLLGSLVLKEPFGRGRVLGSTFILFGLVLIAVAP